MRAVASFTIDSWKEKPWHRDRAGANRLTRTEVIRSYQGSIRGRSKAELVSAYSGGEPRVYSGLELVRCELEGREGSFTLFHVGRIEPTGTELEATIVDGSGTGALAGITGRAEISRSTTGEHRVVLDYDLMPGG